MKHSTYLAAIDKQIYRKAVLIETTKPYTKTLEYYHSLITELVQLFMMTILSSSAPSMQKLELIDNLFDCEVFSAGEGSTKYNIVFFKDSSSLKHIYNQHIRNMVSLSTIPQQYEYAIKLLKTIDDLYVQLQNILI